MRRYWLAPDDPPDSDSRTARICDRLLRRAHDFGWVMVACIGVIVLLAVLVVALLLLLSVAAIGIVVVRLAGAAFGAPLPSPTTILAAMPGVALSMLAVIARRKIATRVRSLYEWMIGITRSLTGSAPRISTADGPAISEDSPDQDQKE
jgi:hypothetical protein